MAKLTKSEMEIQERRKGQIAALDQSIQTLAKTFADAQQKKEKVELLQSVSLGLYEEMDKLAKKAGADQVTDLALEQINDFIRDAKVLMADDAYVQRHKEFVAAGDNPEYRDVVVVLRQLRQGLERLQLGLNSSQSRWKELLADAKGVRVAVQLDLESDEVVSKSDLKGYDVVAKDRWFTATEDFEEPVFSFDALDRIDISTHFAPEQ